MHDQKGQHVSITIRHTHEDGTLVEGSAKGDGVYEILRYRGFRYFPSIEAIGIRQSRDRVAKRHVIEAGAEALRAAGFEVAVEIDDTPRAHEQVRADRAERLEDRAEALAGKAGRLMAEADARFARAKEIADRRPFGQPILIGHHSEAGARADQRRIETNMDKGCEAYRAGTEVERRAQVAGIGEKAHANPFQTARRIETTEAELRGIQRNLDGYTRRLRYGNGHLEEPHAPATGAYREQLLARQALVEEQLRYDRALLAAAQAEGRVKAWGKDNVHKGDAVRLSRGGQWRRVARANAKTVSVETGYSWTDRVAYHQIIEVRCEHDQPAVEPQELDTPAG